MMGLLSKPQKIAKWKLQNELCPLCEEAILEDELFNGDLISIDHIVPRAHGGSDHVSNLNVAHVPCNNAKGCGCSGAVCEYTGRVFPQQRQLGKRHHAWRRQGHVCYLCNVVISPSHLSIDEIVYYEAGRIYHRCCYR